MVKKKSKMAKKEVVKKEKKVTTKTVGHNEKMNATQASDELAKYLMDNKLDPSKDWTQDPVHGKKIRELMQVVKVNREKLEDKVDGVKVKNLQKPKINQGVKKVTKQPLAYEYPEVDGKPMDGALKKKYRQKMRALLKANMDPKEAEKKAVEFLTPKVKGAAEFKAKQAQMVAEGKLSPKVLEEKPKKSKKDKDKKKDKKKKKVSREED